MYVTIPNLSKYSNKTFFVMDVEFDYMMNVIKQVTTYIREYNVYLFLADLWTTQW